MVFMSSIRSTVEESVILTINMQILFTIPCISCGTNWENLCRDQNIFPLVIISFNPLTCLFDVVKRNSLLVTTGWLDWSRLWESPGRNDSGSKALLNMKTKVLLFLL